MLDKLNPREKLVIALGVSALAIILLIYGLVTPLVERRARSRQQALVQENELREMLMLREEYERLQQTFRRQAAILKQRPSDFSLFSFLDRLAGQIGLKDKIVYMKPSTVKDNEQQADRIRVEIKLDKATLAQISRFLYRVETAPHLIEVSRMAIQKKEQADGLLETVLQVETIGS